MSVQRSEALRGSSTDADDPQSSSPRSMSLERALLSKAMRARRAEHDRDTGAAPNESIATGRLAPRDAPRPISKSRCGSGDRPRVDRAGSAANYLADGEEICHS